MNSKNVKILKDLIKKLGKDYHIDKIAEECLELSLAIVQYKCATKLDKKKRLEHIYKELADVKIAIRQADEIYNRKKINRFVTQKLQKKQLKYLKDEQFDRQIQRNTTKKSRSNKRKD